MKKRTKMKLNMKMKLMMKTLKFRSRGNKGGIPPETKVKPLESFLFDFILQPVQPAEPVTKEDIMIKALIEKFNNFVPNREAVVNIG